MNEYSPDSAAALRADRVAALRADVQRGFDEFAVSINARLQHIVIYTKEMSAYQSAVEDRLSKIERDISYIMGRLGR